MTDESKIAEWLSKNQPQVIEMHKGGENVVKHFFSRKKKAAKKETDVTTSNRTQELSEDYIK